MKIPEGLDVYNNEDKCLLLDKAIYGLVQAARQFHRRLTTAMEDDMGFDKCLADECLLRKKTKKGTVIVCVYIDDTLCVGDKEAINEFKKEITLHFTIKEVGEMKEYVGCKAERRGKDNLIMFQDDLIN